MAKIKEEWLYQEETSAPRASRVHMGGRGNVKFFLDTEFIEYPCSIDLVSIGIVSDSGREYYAVSQEFDSSKADSWVKANVLKDLPVRRLRKPKRVIAQEIIEFVHAETTNPEFWGYYAAYDWVVFCWLFGKMVDLPKGFPMYCRDVKQIMDASGASSLPDPVGAHNALVDAKWTRDLYYHVMQHETAAIAKDGKIATLGIQGYNDPSEEGLSDRGVTGPALYHHGVTGPHHALDRHVGVTSDQAVSGTSHYDTDSLPKSHIFRSGMFK